MQPALTRRRLLAAAASGLALPLAGCGGGLLFDTAFVRFVNGSVDDTSVDAYVDGRRVAQRVGGRGGVTEYSPVDAGSLRLEFTRASEVSTIASADVRLDDDERITALLVGTLSQRSLRVLRENNGEADSGQVRLRGFHGAAGRTGLDVYVTASDTALADATPLFTLAEFGQVGNFVTEPARTRRIRVTEAGRKDVVLFDRDGVQLFSRETATLAVVSAQQGSLVAVTYLPENGVGAVLPNALLT